MNRETPPGTNGFVFVCLLTLGSLFALTGLRQFFIEPLESTSLNVLWFFIQVLPLLIILPGLIGMRVRAYFFAALIATLYFVHGVWLMVDVEMRTLGTWEVGFALALVFAASYVMRLLRAVE